MDRVDQPASQNPAQNRSYRVLMIAPTSFFAHYGCHVRILEEIRVLQSMGHSITLVTYRNGSDVDGIDIRRTLPIPWRQDYEVGSSRHKIVFDMLMGLKTTEVLLRERFDVIHAHLHEGALLGLVLGRMRRLPVIFDFQGSLTGEMLDHGFLREEGLLYEPVRRLEQWIDRRSSLVLTSSGNARHLLTEDFACDPARIRTVPDCVHTDIFQPATAFDAEALLEKRRSLGIPDNAKLIVYLGLLAEYQGTDLLLQAMQRIVSEHPNVYLLLMGFPGVDTYQMQAEALGVSDHVRFTGRVPYDEAPFHLALGDAAVAPKLSLTEGSGKLLNYMATALPTVAFDTPVAREYLGPNGLLAVRGDAGSLAEKLKQALSLDEDASHLGQKLRTRVEKLFDWRNAGQIIEDAYAEVLGHASPETVRLRQMQAAHQYDSRQTSSLSE